MNKLRLESLEVTSFEPLPAQPRGRGTVQGQAEPVDGTAFDCPTYPQGFSIHIECNYVTSPLYNCTAADCTADFTCSGDSGDCPVLGA